jgi:DNA-directed RNA polymerase subunit omega
MARVTIEDCLRNLDSRFSLVHLAVRRVLQLRAGAPSMVHAPKNKEVVLALREIAAGKVSPENIRELEEAKAIADVASKAKEEATHREVEEIVEAATHNATLLEFEDKDELVVQDLEQDEEL